MRARAGCWADRRVAITLTDLACGENSRRRLRCRRHRNSSADVSAAMDRRRAAVMVGVVISVAVVILVAMGISAAGVDLVAAEISADVEAGATGAR
jgi:hypothetical protein